MRAITMITATGSPTLRFHTIAPTRVHEEVVHQIVYAIRSGLLKEGDRLPTIESIAETTGVSKPVVGEAVRTLRDFGVVETKRGVQGGVTVVSEEIPLGLLRIGGWRGATLTELVEARRPLERELAELAALRATDDDIASMRRAIDTLEQAGDEPDGELIRLDHRFHYLVARAARSEMLAYFHHTVLTATTVYLHEYGLFHADRSLVVDTHREMLNAIESRDLARIARATDRHWETSGGAFADADLDTLVPSSDV